MLKASGCFLEHRGLPAISKIATHRRISFRANSLPKILSSFIDGKYSQGRGDLENIVNPATGTKIGSFKSVEVAELPHVEFCAKRALNIWKGFSGKERSMVLHKIAQKLSELNAELAELEMLDTGRPIAETNVVDIESARECFQYFAGVAPTISGQHIDMGSSSNGSFAYTRREALGVCAGIGAWNYPLQVSFPKFLRK